LYYFDGTTRYIVNIFDESIFNVYVTNYIQSYIAASGKEEYEDITVTVD
jgi:hypothetical protein